ncbi:MAG: GntR family transcriptional regulator [Kiritimatiellia bacterium]
MIVRDGKNTLHSQIRTKLISLLESFNDGDRLPTEMEFAEKYGVSRLTVHKVMNELSRDGYVVRRAGRGTFARHGDRRVHTDDFNATNGSVFIAYPDWFSYDFWTKIRRVRQLAMTNSMALVDYMITQETMFASLSRLVEKQKDLRGLLVIPPGGNLPGEALELFESFGVPVVILGSMIEVPKRFKNVYTVCQDHGNIGYSDIQILCDRGHEQIAYIASEPWGASWSQEVQGMKNALADRNLPMSSLRLPSRLTKPWENSTHMSYEMTRNLLTEPLPTAIIFESLPSALGGIKALREHPGITLEDITLVVNAPWRGLEEYLWPLPILIYCDPARVADEAFQIINSPKRPAHRQILVKDLTVNDLRITAAG